MDASLPPALTSPRTLPQPFPFAGQFGGRFSSCYTGTPIYEASTLKVFSGREMYRLGFSSHLKGAETRQGRPVGPLPAVHFVIDEPRGYSLAFLLKDQSPAAKAVISGNLCREYVCDLVELGASLVISPAEINSLMQWVHRISDGQRQALQSTTREPLPRRDRAILRGIALGLSNKQIAKELSLCDQTVKNGLSRILAEISARNRVEAALYYWGLLEGP